MDGAAGLASEHADLELLRVSIAPEGAFGIFLLDGLPTGLWSIERTYPVDDAAPQGPQFTKIPAGRYSCARTRFYRGGYDTFEVTGVTGHSRLLFHIANDESDVDGCVGVGRQFGWIGIKPCVLESVAGFTEFMRLMGDKRVFDLLIRHVR